MGLLRNLCIASTLFVFGICGCEQTKTEKVELSPTSIKVVEVLKDVSKEDTLTLYWLFSGCADYTEKYSGITKTNQINKLFRTVKDRYGKPDGWLDKEGESNDISDLLETSMKENGFDMPKDFDSEQKIKFVKIYREFADGCLSSYKDKK